MDVQFGPYELKRQVGVGGMAEVLLAVERLPTGVEREVVLKRILPAYASDPDYAEFFEHEARVALGLQHPNIVSSYAFGEVDGVMYLSMELVRGETLLGMLKRAHKLGRKLDVAAVVRVGAEVAAALAHTHSATDPAGNGLHIIHRDISPQNVLVSHEGAVKLADFGVARTTSQGFRTQTGVVKGKFAYLAPEQILNGRDYDHRVDLFSLGVILFEALSSRSLFRGKSDIETVERVVNLEVPRLDEIRPEVPGPIARVIEKCLERDPARRWSHATEMLEALEDAAEASQLPLHAGKLRAEMRALFGDVAPRQPTLLSDDSGARELAELPPTHKLPDAVPMPEPTRNTRAPSPDAYVLAPRMTHDPVPRAPTGTPPEGHRRVLAPVELERPPRPSSAWDHVPTRKVDDTPDLDLERFLKLAGGGPGRAQTSPAVARGGVVVSASTVTPTPIARSPFASRPAARPDRPAGAAAEFDHPSPTAMPTAVPEARIAAVVEALDEELAAEKLTNVVTRPPEVLLDLSAQVALPAAPTPLTLIVPPVVNGTALDPPSRLASLWEDLQPWLAEPIVLAAAAAAMAAVVLALLS